MSGPSEAGLGDAEPRPTPDATPEPQDAAPRPEDAAAAPPAPGARPRFAFPIHPEDRASISHGLMFGLDRDRGRGGGRTTCRAYDDDPFPACYGGHDGSDFVLNGGFRAMDAGSARVIAPAGGVVVAVEDGHFDRCRGSVQSLDVDCQGHPMRANRVHLRHANGWETHALHLMKDSVAVRLGERVACGAVLGRVGSSGYSSLPHLHFEVRDPQGRVVDPYDLDPDLSLWRVPETAADIRPGDGCDLAWSPPPP